MLYPLKFKPVYKDYVWGGRNLEKLGKDLPEGITAESWEIACHPDGQSVIANGDMEGMTLNKFIEKYGREAVGTALEQKDVTKFPLMVKFIDAEKNLSVQVHPDDEYALANENNEYGKNEMWYILSAKPGARLIYGVTPGTTRESFEKAVNEGKVESCLKSIEVKAGDAINIPAGMVHAIGEGIMLAEIQQNSNITYRIYDFGRTGRELHIKKALDVINFNSNEENEKCKGLEMKLEGGTKVRYLVANKYFSVELYEVKGKVNETADGSRFYLYVFLEGEGRISYKNGLVNVKYGESVMIPASMGDYSIEGNLKALKAYLPDIEKNIVQPLKKVGYSEEKIYENVCGINILHK